MVKKQEKQMLSKLRIIGGRWRGRKIFFLNIPEIRPTPDRVRETLFNWLAPVIEGAHCLDAYAGSGALGFEALSRGAKSVTMIDSSIETVGVLKKNAEILQAENLDIITGCFPQVLENIYDRPFDIVFLDPPFHQNLVSSAADWLEQHHCLSAESYIYIETEEGADISLPLHWKIIRNKKAGRVNYLLAKKFLDS